MFEEFSPPDEGLNPGEEVVWDRRAGMSAKIMIGGTFCLVFWPWVILFVAISLGPLFTNLAILFFFIVMFLTIVDLVNSRRTRYYLTNERIVEVRGGFIRTQIPLSNLPEAGTDEVLEIKSTFSEGSKTFYQAKIRDPTTRKLMILTGLDEDARDIIQKVID